MHSRYAGIEIHVLEIIYAYMYFISKDREKEEQEVPGWEGVHGPEEQQ